VGEYVVAFLLKAYLKKIGFFCYWYDVSAKASIRRLSFENPHHLFDEDFLFYSQSGFCHKGTKALRFLFLQEGNVRKAVF
jgi:hypothetical protein